MFGRYEPTCAGPHRVSVTLDGKEVPQSPVLVEVAPGPDLSRVRLNDFEDEVFVDCTNEFEVDPSDVYGDGDGPDGAGGRPAGGGGGGGGGGVGPGGHGGRGSKFDPEASVDCEITGPSGEPVDTYVNKIEPDGPFHVSCLHTHFTARPKFLGISCQTITIVREVKSDIIDRACTQVARFTTT